MLESRWMMSVDGPELESLLHIDPGITLDPADLSIPVFEAPVGAGASESTAVPIRGGRKTTSAFGLLGKENPHSRDRGGCDELAGGFSFPWSSGDITSGGAFSPSKEDGGTAATSVDAFPSLGGRSSIGSPNADVVFRPPLSEPAAAYALTSLPALNSLPGASASLYLDFDGHYEPQWGSYGSVTTPAFDQDGSPGTFSDSELATIRQIWAYVAEDYAPLAINVTTVEPPSFANGDALRVVIGGDSSWLGGAYGGVSYIDSFTNSLANTVYVFPKHLANGNAKYTADAASHEAGHGFGLLHQSDYDANGVKTAEYYAGPGDGRAPLMGNSYASTRSVWWNGPTSRSAVSYQDDLALLARPANGFGYRADDHGDSSQAATPLTRSGAQLSGSGLIGSSSDADVFSFQSGPGQVSVAVDVPASVQNLDATLQLLDASGTVLAAADPSTSFGASIVATVAGGAYFLRVGSHGNYGDVGTYTIRGTAPAATTTTSAPTVAAPSDLSAAAVSSSRIDLTWTDNATNETGYQVERSTNGSTWSRVASLAAGATRYENTGLVAGTKYYYRVRAVHASAASAYSATATATTLASATALPAKPSNLRATVVSPNQVDLTWEDNATNETGYRIEYYVRQVGRWARVADVGPGVTSYSDTAVVGGRTYYYRVRAVNEAGVSPFSNIVRAITPVTKLVAATRGTTPQTPGAATRSLGTPVVDVRRPSAEPDAGRGDSASQGALSRSRMSTASLFPEPEPLLALSPFHWQPLADGALDAAFADHAWLDRLRVDWS